MLIRFTIECKEWFINLLFEKSKQTEKEDEYFKKRNGLA